MIHKALDWIIGSGSKRYQMTLLYTIIYVTLALVGKLDAVAFATFSGLFGVWIIGDTVRK